MTMTGKWQVRIPTIGEMWTLAKPWTFTCIAEYRNRALMDYLTAMGVIRYCGQPFEVRRQRWVYDEPAAGPWRNPGRRAGHEETVVVPGACRRSAGHDGDHGAVRDEERWACTLPRGTRLRVDRIYIRKGNAAYDSVTFWAIDLARNATGKVQAVRFFARLADVNEMVVVAGDQTLKPQRVELAPVRAIFIRDREKEARDGQ